MDNGSEYHNGSDLRVKKAERQASRKEEEVHRQTTKQTGSTGSE